MHDIARQSQFRENFRLTRRLTVLRSLKVRRALSYDNRLTRKISLKYECHGVHGRSFLARRVVHRRSLVICVLQRNLLMGLSGPVGKGS